VFKERSGGGPRYYAEVRKTLHEVGEGGGGEKKKKKKTTAIRMPFEKTSNPYIRLAVGRGRGKKGEGICRRTASFRSFLPSTGARGGGEGKKGKKKRGSRGIPTAISETNNTLFF